MRGRRSVRSAGAVLGGAIAGMVVALVVVTVTTTRPEPVTSAPVATATAAPSPTGYFVDPQTPAARQPARWRADGRAADAAALEMIAAQPVPLWLASDSVDAELGGYLERARAAAQRPLLVVYHIPDRDCGSYSGGGARDADDYARWIRTVAARLRGVDATVVLEPDAVPHELSGCVGSADRRRAMLADAVDVLKAAGPVTVYLDAGNPGFVTDVDALAAALRGSGLDRADGFSLNVANFWSTADNLAYGLAVSDRVGGRHFVIDTSRNGNGPVRGATVDGGPAFCNPPGRALGAGPTLATGSDRVDALLWIKRVGESDGACRPGEPPAGQWWPEYALDLVRTTG